MINFEATLEKVRSETKRNEDESDEQYAARTLHMAYMLIEHSPQDAVLVEEKEEE